MTFNIFILNFLYSFIATIFGGMFLALIFFWVRENVFPLPKVNGRWYFEVVTLTTSYNPYKNMVLHYVAMLWQEGNHVKGTVEKIYEDSSTGKREFNGSNRTRGIANGFIEKKYFSKDRVILHVVEDGHGRESTNFYDLIVKCDDRFEGEFSSMVASQGGVVKWQRSKF